MQFIDTHIHLQDFKSNCATDIINQAQNQGVKRLICVSSVAADWAKVAEMATKFAPFVVPAFGLHPWYVEKAEDNWAQKLEEYVQAFPKALIGECGLDKLKNPNFTKQTEVFAQQIDLAQKYARPLIIHAVKADEWLNEFWKKLPESFVFHSFTSSAELAQKVIKNGGLLGFNFSLLRSKNMEKLLSALPADKILLETDGPYQGPTKGKEVLPTMLPELLAEIAAIRGEDKEALARRIYQNSEEFINFGK